MQQLTETCMHNLYRGKFKPWLHWQHMLKEGKGVVQLQLLIPQQLPTPSRDHQQTAAERHHCKD